MPDRVLLVAGDMPLFDVAIGDAADSHRCEVVARTSDGAESSITGDGGWGFLDPLRAARTAGRQRACRCSGKRVCIQRIPALVTMGDDLYRQEGLERLLAFDVAVLACEPRRF